MDENMNYLKTHQRPIVAVDIVVFTIENGELKVLLINRDRAPYAGFKTLVGCFMNIDETPEEAVMRSLKIKAGVNDLYIEQLYTFGEIVRDPRDRIMSVSYFALVKCDDIIFDNEKAEFVNIEYAKNLGFDHDTILRYAIQRLQWKFEYTTVAFTLLPELFTLPQLQKVYEIVFNKEFDKRNFRKKILSLDIIEKTDDTDKNSKYKPAALYRFTGRIGDIINVL